MNTNIATYSYKNVLECIEEVKTLNITVTTKKEHFAKLFEVKKIYDFCYKKTNCLLFDTEYSYWKDYSKLVNMDIEHKKVTKKQLDRALKNCILDLQRQIKGIYEMMENKEVNTVA